jgi:hypothetical protein
MIKIVILMKGTAALKCVSKYNLITNAAICLPTIVEIR